MNDLLEERLKALIPSSSEPLFQAVRYALLNPGKRLRPQLIFHATLTFEAPLEKALDPACAMEMIHTYSLIHDDLPCMDDDDLRRGRPTLHKAFDEGLALLAGDYLLTRAFQVLAEAPHLDAASKLQLIQILSSHAAAPGLIGGQAIDIGAQGKQLKEEELFSMHRGKTGALIAACLEFGAVIAQADASYLPLLKNLGEEIGLAYQFLDDLRDATSTTALLGKTVRADAARNKPTAISLYGIEMTQQKLDAQIQGLLQTIALLPGEGKQLQAFVANILSS